MLLLALLLAGCRCGSCTIENSTMISGDGHPYDGTWHEICGVLFTVGAWNTGDDGLADIRFEFDKTGRGWQALDIDAGVSFPNALLVPGTTITAEEMVGEASIDPCDPSCRGDRVALSSGTIEVLGGWEGEDPCEPDEGPVMRLRWDLVFGDGVGPTYALQGRDRVEFATWLSPPCAQGF